MKPKTMVYAIIVFGLLFSFVTPHLTEMLLRDDVYEKDTTQQLASTNAIETDTEIADSASNVDLAIATPEVQEEKKETTQEVTKEETKEEVVKETTPEVQENPIVYDGLTMEELTQKLDSSLHSTLKGTGNIYAKYALEYGVDPYLVTAISLHETGCNWSCSTIVKQCNNVGGMKKGGTSKCEGTSYTAFSSLEEGIKGFIKNIKENYYDYGLTTAEQMNKKYASSTTWATKVNSYINKIKAA